MYNKEVIIVFTQTDLPDPVVPAINKWGIEVKSPIIGTPEILLPKAIGNFNSRLLNRSFEIISLKKTLSLFSLGISIPTVFLPGITATRAEVELVFLARSSDKFTIFETLTPAAGSNSYKLTTGPLLIFLGALSLSFGGLIVKSFEGATLWQILFWRSLFFSLTVLTFLIISYKR